jgi:hypothetical protein
MPPPPAGVKSVIAVDEFGCFYWQPLSSCSTSSSGSSSGV